MDYPYAEFGDFSFIRFVFVVRTESQRDRQTESQMDDRYTQSRDYRRRQ